MRKLRALLYLDLYALLLFAAVAAWTTALVCVEPLRPNWALLAVQILALLYVFSQAAAIQSTLSYKYQAFLLLRERCRREFGTKRFAPYMESPCGRHVVKAVLRDIGRFDAYRELCRRYGLRLGALCERPRNGYVFTVYENGVAVRTYTNRG